MYYAKNYPSNYLSLNTHLVSAHKTITILFSKHTLQNVIVSQSLASLIVIWNVRLTQKQAYCVYFTIIFMTPIYSYVYYITTLF